MKKQLLILGIVLFSTKTYSQTAISPTNVAPDPKAMLEVIASDKGLLLPRVDLQTVGTGGGNLASSNPEALMVYNTNAAYGSGKGYYYWNGLSWERLQPQSSAGTVTNVSVTTANGVSGTVSNPTSTPAISLSLGNITPTSVAATGTVTGSNISGTNTGDQTITLTGDVTGSGTGSFVTTIGSNTVVSSMILDGTVSNADLANSSVTVTAGTGLSGGGTVALGSSITLNNTAPDQTVAITGGGINSVTGTYPNFTVTGTEVDGSVTNEAQTISAAGGATPTINLSTAGGAGGGTVTLSPGTGVGLSQTGNTITVTNTAPSSGGTVTDVSVTSNNGITSSVTNSTSTPAITLGLGAITPSSVAATGTVSGTQLISTVSTGTAPLVVTSTTPVANLNIGGNAATVTTNANLTGPITSSGNVTSVASQTGTGSTFVMNTSPTLVTPNLGTPTAATLTNATGLPLTTGVTGVLPIANGGTNSGTALSGSSIMVSNGTQVVQGQAGTTTTVLHGNAAGAPTYSGVVSTDITDATIATVDLANNSVTNPILNDMAVNTIKGRITAGTGDPEDLSAAQVRTILGFPNPVNGLGTTNYVPKWTPDGSTLGNSLLFDNGTNVGIGNSAPKGKLDVVYSGTLNTTTPGNTLYNIHLTNSAQTLDYATGITFGNTNNTLAQTSAGIYVQTSGAYGSKMYFGTTNSYATGSQTRMMIDHLGNVGIGTTSPGRLLEVYGTTPGIKINDPTATGNSFVELTTVDGGVSYFQNVLGRTRIFVGGAERMTFLTNGNVGVGTTAPTSLLSVGTASQFQVNSTGAIASATGITSSGNITFSALAPNLPVYTTTGGLLTTTPSTTGVQGYWTRTGTNLSNTTLSDNVGIGISAPSARFDVSGTSRFRGNMGIDGGSTFYLGSEENLGGTDIGGADFGYLRWDNDNNTYNYWGDGTENGALVIGSSNDGANANSDVVVMAGQAANVFAPVSGINYFTGNVGVGNFNPSSLLHVMGKINIHQSGSSGGQNRFEGINAPTDANGRAQLVLSSAYSDLVIASSNANANHGSTLSFTAYNPADANDYRKFVINQGNWGARQGFLDFGYGDAGGRSNPHTNINTTDGVLSLDGISKRVGIRTMTPSTSLEVTHNGASTFGTAVVINQNAIGNSDGPKLQFQKTMSTSKSWSAGILNGVDVGTFAISEDGGVGGFGTPRFQIAAGGNAGIGANPLTGAGQARLSISRDGVQACCGGESTTLGLGEQTAGGGATGRRASIAFHNASEAEGVIQLIQNTVNGVSTRRIQFYDNQTSGLGLELEDGSRLLYGNGLSRTESRDNAGLQGNSGAQSGFYETSAPSNYYSGASGWQHLIDVRHSNAGNNYAMQIAGSFFDQDFYARKTNNNAGQGWARVVTSRDLVFSKNEYYGVAGPNNWNYVTGYTGYLDVKAGDLIKFDGMYYGRATGGSGNDYMYTQIEITGCTNTNANQHDYFHLDEGGSDHDNYKPVVYKDVWQSPCNGQLRFRLMIYFGGDDSWEAREMIISATRY